ncbi:hypothetical protein KM759_gp144 [Lymphocystis disease virus 4]|uniref:Uncharacterized protein n=1 Tax=Lymphocystis disease virus 4 TaxID=2704413 RepID=A0A6B9XL96_9VIRU|nr:hypothetical protein KM759_gp144 [Lymphocystis disease virus 4]QHR78504.1 hypothetical protein [Lymphocystis disease virus 4]
MSNTMNCLFDTSGCMLICKNCIYKYDDKILLNIVENLMIIMRRIIKNRYTNFKIIEICRSKVIRFYLACLLDRIRLFRMYTSKIDIISTNYTPCLNSIEPEDAEFNLLKALRELSLTLLTISHIKPYLLKNLNNLYSLNIDLDSLFYSLNKPIKIVFKSKVVPYDPSSLIVLIVSAKDTTHYPKWLTELLSEMDQNSLVYLRPIPKDAVKTNWPYNLIKTDLNIIK